MRFRYMMAAVAIGCMSLSIPASAKSAKECNAEYAANKAAIQGAGQKKADFIKACREGTEAVPSAGGTAAAPSPAPAQTAAPAQAAKPALPAAAAPAGANQFSTEAEAKTRCPSGVVVWVNLKSRVYHFAGSRSYGRTKQGAYMCESDAIAAGDRAAKNEKHAQS